ncbi:DUF4418 family protein [Lachnospiraceae bacterium ZAX-1]
MKNRILVGAIAIVAGALIAIGPQFLFKICEQTHHAITTCYWTAQAEIGVGGVIALLGIAYLLFGDSHARVGLNLAIGLNSVLAFLIPNVLIGVCEMPTMDCRIATLPALNVISILAFALTVGNTIYLWRLVTPRKESPENETADTERI